jgi:hypothetical protein
MGSDSVNEDVSKGLKGVDIAEEFGQKSKRGCEKNKSEQKKKKKRRIEERKREDFISLSIVEYPYVIGNIP